MKLTQVWRGIPWRCPRRRGTRCPPCGGSSSCPTIPPSCRRNTSARHIQGISAVIFALSPDFEMQFFSHLLITKEALIRANQCLDKLGPMFSSPLCLKASLVRLIGGFFFPSFFKRFSLSEGGPNQCDTNTKLQREKTSSELFLSSKSALEKNLSRR